MRYLFCVILFISSFSGFSEDVSVMSGIELKLDSVFKKLRGSSEDKDFIKYNTIFKSQLKEVLVNNKESFEYPFDSLKSMSKITSPDGEFRLFNWNVESEAGMHSFIALY